MQLSRWFLSTIGSNDLPSHKPFGICSTRTGNSFLNILDEAPNKSCPTLEGSTCVFTKT